MNNHIRRFLAVFLFFVCGTFLFAQKNYFNVDYGFKVKIPAGISVITDDPPQPNHGFRLTLGDGQSIVVFADYNTMEEPNTEEALREWLELKYKNRLIKFCGGLVSICGLNGHRVIGTIETHQGNLIIDCIKIERLVKNHTSETLIRYLFTLESNAQNYSRNSLILYYLLENFKIQSIDGYSQQ